MLHLDLPSFRKGVLLVCRDGNPLCDFDMNDYPPQVLKDEYEEYSELSDALDAGEGVEWAVEADEATPWVTDLITEQIEREVLGYFAAIGPASRMDDIVASEMYREIFAYREFMDYIEFKCHADDALQAVSVSIVTGWIALLGLAVGDSDMEDVFEAIRDVWEETWGEIDGVAQPSAISPSQKKRLIDTLLGLGCVNIKDQH